MSGFEIAGVILGAFPILISALKGYGELARKVGHWSSIRQEYQKCKNEINAQHVEFIGNLRRLLLTLGVDDARISRLLAGPGGEEWKDADLAYQLQDHLRDSYDVFLGTIQDMNKAMEDLKKEIIIDSENLRQKIEQTKLPELATRLKEVFKRFGATRDYQLYRMQFVLGESARKRLFDEMKGYNDRLRNLLETSTAVSQAQKARKAEKQAREYYAACGLWKQADQLYSALSKAWNCSCWKQHHAHLLLQDRHQPSPEPHFHLMLWSDSPHLPLGPNSKSWLCRPTRVEIFDEPEAPVPIRIGPAPNLELRAGTPLHRTLTPLKPSIASGKHQKQARAKFKGVQEYVLTRNLPVSSSSPLTSSRAPLVTNTMVEDIPEPKTSIHESEQRGRQTRQIPSLCAALRQQSPFPASCPGYLLSACSNERYYVYPASDASTHINPNKPKPVTLEGILRDSNHLLTRLQRFTLAVTVASSFIQLAGTPWIKVRWAKSDVVFFPDPAEPRPHIFLERPFVSRDFLQGSYEPVDVASPKVMVSDELIHGFESLGIVLLELCFGKPIEMHPSWPSLPAGSGFMAALEWLKDVAEEAGPEYADAVAWCLIGGRTISTGRGEGWRTVMSDRVVKPLGQCRSYIAPVR